ncbi:MAG TPA: glycoside hydrolase family 27 protein [Candidatus Acidoferrales bacterium]|nr:glycoside hydrolase family 27 protein [Candidatus Acidoferrales bacterium]
MRKIVFTFLMLASISAFAQKFDGLALTPPMGWNSWNTFATNVDENLIKSVADAMIMNGMWDAGYIYIVIDDGWEAMQRDSLGNIFPDPKRFPHGMKALGNYLHAHGFKFGIHNCAGTETCSGFPGGRGHEYQDARTYASWGVDYLKYDWCNHGTANAEETYKTMRDALYHAGRPVVFSICEWGTNEPWIWGPEIGHLWRTTGDITDCYDCQGVYSMGWKYILDKEAELTQYAGPDHWNDPDMLEVGNKGLTLAESRAHFTLWCMLAAPLMAGNDVRNMPEEIRDILTNKEVVAIDQDSLGKQGFRYMDQIGKQIWAKELSNGAWAICVFNSSTDPFKIRIDWNSLPFLKGTYSIRDIWHKQNLSTTASSFIEDIQSRDVVLLRLTPVK